MSAEPPVIQRPSGKKPVPKWVWICSAIGLLFIIAAIFDDQNQSDNYVSSRVAAEMWLKEHAHDPSSVEIVDASGVKSRENGDVVMLVKYRARNPFGALVLSETMFLIRKGQVIEANNLRF